MCTVPSWKALWVLRMQSCNLMLAYGMLPAVVLLSAAQGTGGIFRMRHIELPQPSSE